MDKQATITKTMLDKLRNEGKSFQECADSFGVSARQLKKWRDESGYVDPKQKVKR